MTAYQLVFTGMLIAGAALFLVSLFFGEIGELIGDAFGDTGGDHDGPSWFSTSVIGAFLIAYGGIGLVATAYTDNGLVATIIGLVVAAACAYAIRNYLLASLMRSQGNTQISQSSYVGSTAMVITTILPRGVGEIRFVDANGATAVVPARSIQTHEPVLSGQSVVIVEMSGGTAIVSTDNPSTQSVA